MYRDGVAGLGFRRTLIDIAVVPHRGFFRAGERRRCLTRRAVGPFATAAATASATSAAALTLLVSAAIGSNGRTGCIRARERGIDFVDDDVFPRLPLDGFTWRTWCYRLLRFGLARVLATVATLAILAGFARLAFATFARLVRITTFASLAVLAAGRT